jgi:phosphoglycerate dehydrogenase-like enzyme
MRQGHFHVNSVRHVSYELCGKTIGIIGLGRIGKGVAERLKPFQVRTIYHDILMFPAELERNLGVTRVPFERLLAESDIVTIHVPRTPSTVDMFDAAAFGRMKPTAFLVNTARGGIVDEDALATALDKGTILGAALDVFEKEPARKDHPLYRFPNVVLTPHIAAGTRDAFEAKMAHIFKNLDAFFNGRPIEDQVDYKADLAAAS